MILSTTLLIRDGFEKEDSIKTGKETIITPKLQSSTQKKTYKKNSEMHMDLQESTSKSMEMGGFAERVKVCAWDWKGSFCFRPFKGEREREMTLWCVLVFSLLVGVGREEKNAETSFGGVPRKTKKAKLVLKFIMSVWERDGESAQRFEKERELLKSKFYVPKDQTLLYDGYSRKLQGLIK